MMLFGFRASIDGALSRVKDLEQIIAFGVPGQS